ncbi:MAG TPA: hypothetical protein VHK67_07485 [Rhabdochlamydiaceae bacterium]|nr:hypothetical protein [Rhabdochlamydiaceae bacterium]
MISFIAGGVVGGIATVQSLTVMIFLDVIRTSLINSLAGRPDLPYIFNPDLPHNKLMMKVILIGAGILGGLAGGVCGVVLDYLSPPKKESN